MGSRGRWLLAAALIAVLILGSSGGAVALTVWRLETSVMASFESGQTHLERGRALVETANKSRDVSLLDRARSEFLAAARDFGDGGRTVSSNPLASLGARVPLVGRPVRSRVDAVGLLAEMGRRLSAAAVGAVDVDALLLQPAGPSSAPGTKRLLEILDKAETMVDTARENLLAAEVAARSVDPGVLPSSQRAALLAVRATIQRGVAGLSAFDGFLPVIQNVLAADGRRTYLIEQVNPFELRAGGGYVGTYSLVAADHGSLSVLRSGDTHALPDFEVRKGASGYVAPPSTLVEFLHEQGWSLGDSNFFPDFPANAKAAEQFAERDFGAPVDGVIALDLYAVAGLLTVTGPIEVPGYQLTVTSDNLLTQMARLDILDPSHKKILSALADPLIQRLTAISSDRWPQLIGVLNQLVSGRHLQLYFNNKQDEAEMVTLGFAGDLAFARHRDFLGLVESNFGGNKANYFLTRGLTLQLVRDGSVLHHRLLEDLSLDLTSAPAIYNVPYRAYLRLMVPAGSSARSVSPVKADDYPYTDPPTGTAAIDGWIWIEPDRASRKGTLRVVYAWDTPWAPGADGRHVIYMQKQPGTGSDPLAVSWTDAGHTASAASDLSVDRVVQLGPDGLHVVQGQAAQAELPRIGV